ncbi:hypothetical protein RH915_11340 [Serpentinicella sp. ANB-PHB4]|nr:hypothetical protein [Serpentinicella sp. ANB-PHB4]MDR5660085.1 hypothetical protein [Serpentinicella sp. ANB-PHB4]
MKNKFKIIPILLVILMAIPQSVYAIIPMNSMISNDIELSTVIDMWAEEDNTVHSAVPGEFIIKYRDDVEKNDLVKTTLQNNF